MFCLIYLIFHCKEPHLLCFTLKGRMAVFLVPTMFSSSSCTGAGIWKSGDWIQKNYLGSSSRELFICSSCSSQIGWCRSGSQLPSWRPFLFGSVCLFHFTNVLHTQIHIQRLIFILSVCLVVLPSLSILKVLWVLIPIYSSLWICLGEKLHCKHNKDFSNLLGEFQLISI